MKNILKTAPTKLVKETCYCITCNRSFHFLGIARHRAFHRDKKEICEIRFTNGERKKWDYTEKTFLLQNTKTTELTEWNKKPLIDF